MYGTYNHEQDELFGFLMCVSCFFMFTVGYAAILPMMGMGVLYGLYIIL